MRVALVAQWLRAAAAATRSGAPTALPVRASASRSCRSVGRLRLWLPDGVAAGRRSSCSPPAELAVPFWAERRGTTPWHPRHIAERYGLFTIIVLGECGRCPSTVALQAASTRPHGFATSPAGHGIGGLLLLFAMWWIYFLHPSADGLRAHQDSQFWWGYGHYAVFASLAALGAGLDVVVAVTADHHGRDFAVSERTVGLVVAGSISVFLLVFGSLQRVIEGLETPGVRHFAGAALLLFGCALLAGPAGLQIALALMTVVLAGVVAIGVVSKHRTAVASG